MLVESLSAESQSNGEEGVERASRNKPRDQEHKSLSNTNKTRPGRLTQTSTVTSGKLSGGRERQHGHEKTFPSINTLPSPRSSQVRPRPPHHKKTRSRMRIINPSLPSMKYINAAKGESDEHVRNVTRVVLAQASQGHLTARI